MPDERTVAAGAAARGPALQRLIDRCLGKEGAYLDNPFGEVPICAKWKGHIFAELYPRPEDFKMTVRCEPEEGRLHRERYPGRILPAYHVPLRQRPYKMTVLLGGGAGCAAIPTREIMKMIDLSYENLRRRHGGRAATS